GCSGGPAPSGPPPSPRAGSCPTSPSALSACRGVIEPPNPRGNPCVPSCRQGNRLARESVVSRGSAAMTESLLADIGGSKSRFALANSAGRPERIAVIDNDTVADLDAAVASYLEETGARPRAATLAVAGPVDGEEVVLTNRTAWRFRRGDLAKRYGFSRLRVVNDFEAIAWALPRLGAAETLPLGAPVPPRAGAKLVL